MEKILIVDDEEKIRNLIKSYATWGGYEVLEAENGKVAIDTVKNEEPDIVLLDVMMPVLDGYKTAREIRAFSSVPIIMLTARNEEYDRIHGFEVGVDDYVCKPFSPRELMLRVEAVLRRTAKPKEKQVTSYEFEGLKLDLVGRRVYVNGVEAVLSPKEYDLVFYMAKNKGVALSREKVISDVWGYDYEGFDRTLDTHIKLLRKNLGEYSKYIQTVRGVGYRFETT